MNSETRENVAVRPPEESMTEKLTQSRNLPSTLVVGDHDQTITTRDPPNSGESGSMETAQEATSDLIQENISVSKVVINLNKVLEESQSSTVVGGTEKEQSATQDGVNKEMLSTSGSILAKYISETRQRTNLGSGTLQLQRNLHLLERNNVQVSEKQGHMLNSSVTIYPSKPKSVDSAMINEPVGNPGDLLGRMQGIVQNVGNVPNQGYRVAVPMQHFIQYPQRMVGPYAMAPGHPPRPGQIQLQERTQPPPLIPFQNQMGEHIRLQGYAPGHLQIQRHPVQMPMQAQGQGTFQERIMQLNMQNKMQQSPQLIPRMPMQMQYPTYYPVQNRFPSSVSPSGARERPVSDPTSMNAPGMHTYRSNVHADNFDRYPRSYSEPQEEPNRLNPDLYQQEVYHDNAFRPDTYQRDPNTNHSEMFYRTVPAASDRPVEMYQKSNHGEAGVRRTPDQQSVLQKELERGSHMMNTLEGNKVITKQEFDESVDEAQDDNMEANEFVDFEEAANLNVYTEQHERQPQDGGDNYDENISIEHFLQVDYSDNTNNQTSQHEEQQIQRQGQPLYQMNRQKTIIFKCKYCKKKFFHKRELEKHMISHSTYTRVRSDGKRRDFPCTLCDCSYIRKTHLERHMLSHMRKQDQYKCIKCNFFFVHRRHLEIHNLQTHSGRSVDVEEGNEYDDQVQVVSVDPNAPDFGNETDINIVKVKEEMIDMTPSKPLHKHSNVNRSFFCQHCGRAFLKNQYLRAHIRNFHDGNFSETAVVQMHSSSNPFVQKKNLFCPICGQGFIKMKYFRSHWNKFHEQDHETRTDITKKTNPVPLDAPPPPSVKKPFVCHICNNGFYHPQNLKRHIRDVHYKKRLENAENESTSRQLNTDVSVVVEKPPEKIAPIVKKPAKRPPGSRGSRAFCPICSKEFLYEYNVRRHIRNTHPAYIGMAPVKTKPAQPMPTEDEEQETEQDQSITLSSLSSSNINESQLMGWNMEDDGSGQTPSTSQSTEERPFKCTLCDKKFYRLLFLKRHFGTSHGVLHPDTTEADWSFECQACRKRFARNDSLIRHMKFKHKKLYRTLRAEKIRQNYETASKAQQEEKDSEEVNEPKNTNEEQEQLMEEAGTENVQETETDPFGDVPSEVPAAAPAPKLKIFRCGTCNNSFCTKLEYMKHQRAMHAKQRKHKCKICNFKFAQFSHLRRHITQVHSKQNVGATKKCSKCEFTASNNIALSNHMRAHTREEAHNRYRMPEEEEPQYEVGSPPEEETEGQVEDDTETQQELDTQHEDEERQSEEGVESQAESQDEDFDSRVQKEIESHAEDSQQDIETEPDEETVSQPEDDVENRPENTSDSLAETFNESLAKRLDETLAETMAGIDENQEENPDEESTGD